MRNCSYDNFISVLDKLNVWQLTTNRTEIGLFHLAFVLEFLIFGLMNGVMRLKIVSA